MTRLFLVLALTVAALAEPGAAAPRDPRGQELHLSVNATQQTLAQRVQAAAPPSAPAPASPPQLQVTHPQAVEVRFHLFQSGPALGASVRL